MILSVQFLLVISVFSSGDTKRRNIVDPITEALNSKIKRNNNLNPVEATLNTLQNIILQKDPPKGENFAEIPGPSITDKVCIVGAGPSGVYSALKLKKLGYTDVTIFEKSYRVGGKSNNVDVKGEAYPQGSIFVEPSYFDNIVPLAREYDAGELVAIPPSGIWTTTSSSNGTYLSRGHYYIQTLSEFTNSQDPIVNVVFLVKNIIRYIKVHNELFGEYEGDLMPKPDAATLIRVRGTFLDFLKRENLEPMKVIFKTSHELTGYGFIDEVSALYGLIWNKPIWMYTYALRVLNVSTEEPYNNFMFRDGFEKIWSNIVKIENLNIKFNQIVYSIKRKYDKVLLKIQSGSSLEVVRCGFLIWGGPINPEFLRIADSTDEEWKMFKGLKPSIFTASLVNIKQAIKGHPLDIFLSNLNSDDHINGGLTFKINIEAALTPNIDQPEVLAEVNQRNVETCYTLQLSREYMQEEHLNNMLRATFVDGFNGTSVDILQQTQWPYFYRWSPKEIEEGRLWEVYNIQGKRRTWFVGSSVLHESTRAVTEYINLLFRNMIPHDKFHSKKK